MQIRGGPLADPLAGWNGAAQQEATARAFLRENGALLLLDDPDQELKLVHRQTDDLGQTTMRFAQFYNRIPVWPAEIGVHVDVKGKIKLVDGAYEATPSNVSILPALTAVEAASKARQSLPNGDQATFTPPALILYAPLDRPSRLGWKLEASVALDSYWSVVIDAIDGSTLRAINLCMSGSVPGSGVDLFGVPRALNVWQSTATYYM